MSGFAEDSVRLPTADWRRLDELLYRYESDWSHATGSAPTADLARYLPDATDPLRPLALRELGRAATPALARGVTMYAVPVPCEGSTITGKCEMRRIAGTDARSSVFRVCCANVRTPRSQRITL